jgi:hypothetical protein
LQNKQSDILPEEYQNETIDSLPTEILLPLLKAAAGNKISNLVKLKLVCRRFNCIIKAKSEEFPQLLIRRLEFSQEDPERRLKIFGHSVPGKPTPITVSILQAKELLPGSFRKLQDFSDLTVLPMVSFLEPNDFKLPDLLRHFKIVGKNGGGLAFWTTKVTEKLISEILSLDLSTFEELEFYESKLDISPCTLKALLGKMSSSLREIKFYFCRFSVSLISDDMLTGLNKFRTLTIIENQCGEIAELPFLTLSSSNSDNIAATATVRKITRCGPELRIT